jgi:hypothetical protein
MHAYWAILTHARRPSTDISPIGTRKEQYRRMRDFMAEEKENEDQKVIRLWTELHTMSKDKGSLKAKKKILEIAYGKF